MKKTSAVILGQRKYFLTLKLPWEIRVIMLATDQQIWIADKEFWMKAKTRLKSSFKTLFYSSLQKENIQKELKVLLLSFPFLSVCLSFIPEVANPIILMMKEGGKFAREKSANCKDIKATISPLPTSSTPQIQSAFASPSKNSLEKKWKNSLHVIVFLSSIFLLFASSFLWEWINQERKRETSVHWLCWGIENWHCSLMWTSPNEARPLDPNDIHHLDDFLAIHSYPTNPNCSHLLSFS